MTQRMNVMALIGLVLAAALAACGGNGGDAGDTGGNARAGETLFAEVIIGSQPGCATCHSLEPDQVLVGPSMAGIGSRAGTQVAGMSAEDYLRESILDPDAHVVEGFQPGIMVQVWEETLTAEQVDDLVAYLLTLE
ncbi:MAG TPA: c-type cytochrome [Anaerolineales bacterium]|nr:c-type cytochrome [Anaerolineales bacterium]